MQKQNFRVVPLIEEEFRPADRTKKGQESATVKKY